MKNKYYVISKSGEILDPKDFLKSKDCSPDMRIVIEREAVGIPAPQADAKPEYLEVASKLGFAWEENASQGFLQYDYKAQFIKRLVEEYARSLANSIGFPIYEVRGSNFFDLSHPVVDAYASLFGDRLFRFPGDKEKLVMSYDASYPQFNLAQKYRFQEADLPFGHFSISDCYRYEQSGECMLLLRGRRFFMPDLHPYFADLDQAWEGYFAIEKQLQSAFALAGRDYVNVVKVSNEANWLRYQQQISEIALRNERDILVEVRMDGQDRYWIIDVDYSIVDALKQVREIGCIQIDVGNAKRLGIRFSRNPEVDSSVKPACAGRPWNDKQGSCRPEPDEGQSIGYPVIIHAAVPGGIERYIYMLCDDIHRFPIALQPVQLRLIPVSDKYVEFAESLAHKFADIRIEIDDRSESVSKRIKLARLDLVPQVMVIGEQEQDPKWQGLQKLACKIREQSQGVPFLPISWPAKVSEQVKRR